MASTNFFKAIFASFYSKSFYREVASDWRSRTFLYLLVLLAICWFFISIARTVTFYNVMHEDLVTLSNQMPVMTIRNGVAKTQKSGTFNIRWPQSGQLLAVVNTSGTYKDFRKSKAIVFITKNAVLIKTKGKINSHTYPSMIQGKLGPKEILSNVAKAKYWAVPLAVVVVYLVGLLIAYIYRVIQSLIYAVIGLLFTVILKRELDYVKNLNIAMVAITPAIILCTLAYVLNAHFYFDWLCYFILSMLYLIFGILAQPSKDEMQK